ncbi:tRNA pseudouridine synthase A [Acidithiobacillus ferrivorans SS3]|uniref:tRNA pseudouridine synthase A n=2 Tax=Acidithiobacillus ferrivorans TaxID=160808 RepID=G0JNA0_9PROT|nr:tRNA pseudouridine synthase A [Acidithiobacillus ferrivorans SS3]OFA16777.1 tRNA pseudouridine(38,39,40) synthase TruA [Acidithiobacillus ferrivorans]
MESIVPMSGTRWALGLEYDGHGFCGWQRQLDQESVQGVLETALSRVAQCPISVIVAGRTDTGVHALCQVVHFVSPVVRPPEAWVRGANTCLPKGVALRWAKAVPDHFHARFSAMARRYRYMILNQREKSALWRNHTAWVYRPLDVQAMQVAAQTLLGTHDFSAFRASACQAKSPIRDLCRLQVTRRGDLIAVDAEANGFLHHMVRNLAGVLIAIGKGDRPVGWAAEVLASCDRCQAGVTAPPGGLYFVAPRYPAEFGLPVDAVDAGFLIGG